MWRLKKERRGKTKRSYVKVYTVAKEKEIEKIQWDAISKPCWKEITQDEDTEMVTTM
jgi:hypothetical protein